MMATVTTNRTTIIRTMQFEPFDFSFVIHTCYLNKAFYISSYRSDACHCMILKKYDEDNYIILDGLEGIQEYISRDANNIARVEDEGNIVSIEGNISLYPTKKSHPILLFI